MAEFPTYEEVVKGVVERALDEFLYQGKSIREWVKIITDEDAISRKEVLNQIFYSTDNSGDVVLGSVLRHRIENLPPVKPQEPKTIHSSTYGGVSWGGTYKPQEPKTGRWEWVQYDYNPKLGNWHCSECRCIVVECVDKEEKGGIPLYKYCPQCGAKMQEAEIEG